MEKVILVILDGLGIGENDNQNAFFLADSPVIDGLLENYPNSQLEASGQAVGLPEGQIGNSEVGHMNIGAGRIVYQDLSRINNDIGDRSFFENPALNKAFDRAKDKDKNLHLIGLVSKGGVHSSFDHLLALIDMAKDKDFEKLYIHCFLDGRDVLPKSAYEDIKELEEVLEGKGLGQIATIVGRYYAMDRDNRWERIEKAYRAMVEGQGAHSNDILASVEESYDQDITDEFIQPIVTSAPRIGREDSVIFFNFRADRARQLTRALCQEDFSEFDREDLDLHLVTMTQYDADFQDIDIAYQPLEMKNTLGQYLSSKGLKQLRIAETEKYAHVTFFFNGGIEEAYEREDRILIESPKVPTYDLKPEMSAYELTSRLKEEIGKDKYDFIVVNYANPDMVGHTGDLEAAILAVEAVDQCLGQLISASLKVGYKILVTADHGNCEQMVDKDKADSPYTAHTTNKVPLILIGQEADLEDGKLSNIGPTILDIMDLEKAEEMTENSLIRR